MKRAKKLLALLVAMTMVLGMAVTVSAAPSTQKGTATVKGVTEENAVVTAYQLVTYDDTGVYSVVEALDGVYTVGEDDAEVITSIASDADLLAQLEKTQLTKSGNDYVAQLTAGTYLVLVTNTGAAIYNPMLLSLNVTYPNGTGDGEVDADGNYVIDDATIYAKSTSEVPLEKWITDEEGNKIGADNAGKFDTVAEGDIVYFTIKTMIPSYSDLYDNDNLTFTLTDTADAGLKLDNTDDKLVNAIQEQLGEGAADVVVDGQTITITFDPDYILANQKKEIVIIYSAEMLGRDQHMNGSDRRQPFTKKINNKVELEYSNTPTTTEKITDSTTHYTLDFTIYKIDTDDKDKKDKEYLSGAEFTLTSKTSGKEFTSVSGTDKNGEPWYVFEDVGPGEYILKETKAPNGYALSTVEYTVKVENVRYNTAGLTHYYVGVYDNMGTEIDSVDYTWNSPTITVNQEIEILNDKLANLPSTGGIGTTIFTVGGCAIMIAAAALYLVNRRKSEEN